MTRRLIAAAATAGPAPAARARYRQRAVFLPRGLSGRLYWWALVPAHHLIFDAMASRIVATAEGAQR